MSENAARVRRAYEQRTELKVVPVRLGAEARARLERLATMYGGKREAVEAALAALEEGGVKPVAPSKSDASNTGARGETR